MFKKGWQPENYKGVHDEIKQQHMKTKDMSAKGRFEYFWYYYKVHTLVAVCVIIFGGSLIHDILTAKDYGFYGVMLNASLLDSEAMEASFGEYAQLDLNEYDCMIDTQSQLSYHSQNSYDFATYQKLVAQLQTHELDVLVADAEVFRNFATNEMFMDLREFMSPEELAKYEDRIYYVDMEAVRKAAEAADNVLNEEESTADDAAPQDAAGAQEAEELSPDEAMMRFTGSPPRKPRPTDTRRKWQSPYRWEFFWTSPPSRKRRTPTERWFPSMRWWSPAKRRTPR